jgi:hypothetical protein
MLCDIVAITILLLLLEWVLSLEIVLIFRFVKKQTKLTNLAVILIVLMLATSTKKETKSLFVDLMEIHKGNVFSK